MGSRWLRGSLVLGALSALSWGFFLWIPGRNVILAADLLRFVPPWQHPGPAPQNRLLTDPLWQFFPWFTELRRAVLSGHLPLWDPSMLSGVPVAANPITAFFFPLSWLAIPFGAGAGMSAMAVLRPALAAFFIYLYLRNAGRSTAASWLGAFIYGFSLPFIVWSEHPQDNVFLLAPLVLLAIDALIRNPGFRRSAALAVVFALILLAGHPESAFHLLLFSAAYAIVQAARYRRRRPLAIPFLTLAALWGGALGLFSILPQMNVILASEGFRHAGSHAARAMPLKMVIGFLLPNFFVAGVQHVPTADVPRNLNESACYYGISALALAAAALAMRRRVSRIPGLKFWLATLGAIVVLIFVAPRCAFFERLPILGQTFHNRLTILAGLAVAVLASEACDGLSRFSSLRATFAAALAGTFGAILFLPRLAAGRAAPPAQLLTAAGVIIACGAALLLQRRAGAAAVLLCAVEFVDLWHAGSRYHPLSPVEDVYPPIESAARLRAWEGRGRILPLGATFFPNSMSVYRLRDVRGYDAVESDDYRRARAGLARWVSDYGVPDEIAAELTPRTERLLSLFAVEELVLPPGMSLSPSSLRELAGRPVLSYRGSDATIYRVAESPGRFQNIGRIVPSGSENLDPSRESAVEGIAAAEAFPMARRAEVRLLRDEPERIELTTFCPGPFFLRISDSFDPGWHARLDGNRLQILRADTAFRGAFVPAGEHRIEMTYSLPGFPWTGIISLVSCLAAAIALGRHRRLERSCRK